MDLPPDRIHVELRREPVREDDHDALPRCLDPEAPAGEAGVAERAGREGRTTRAVVALSRPAEGVRAFSRERPRHGVRCEDPPGMEPLAAQRQHLLGGHEETGMPSEAGQSPRVPVLRHATQEGSLPGELQTLRGGELDLFPVVEPAFDDLFRRRASRQRAERSEAERRGNVKVEQLGEALAGGPLGRQAPEDVAEIAVGRELAASAGSLRPKAFFLLDSLPLIAMQFQVQLKD